MTEGGRVIDISPSMNPYGYLSGLLTSGQETIPIGDYIILLDDFSEEVGRPSIGISIKNPEGGLKEIHVISDNGYHGGLVVDSPQGSMTGIKEVLEAGEYAVIIEEGDPLSAEELDAMGRRNARLVSSFVQRSLQRQSA